MKFHFVVKYLDFQRHSLLRPSKVRKLFRTNQFQVKSTKNGYCKVIEEREENIDIEEREKERERGLNLRRQRLASPTAQVLVASGLSD